MAASISPRSRSTSDAPVEARSTSVSIRLSITPSSPIARPPTRAAELGAPFGRAVGDRDVADAGAVERDRHGGADVAGADHEHAPAFESAEPLAGHGDGRRRHRHGVAADCGLGPGALADLHRLTEDARHERSDHRLVLGDPPRLPHLPEDLALTDDHRVDAGRHAEQVRDGGVVVVRVQVVADRVGIERRLVGEEVADVLHRRVEARAACVDLGAVARRERPRPRRGSRCAPACAAPWAARVTARPSARGARPGSCGGSGQ